MTTQYNDLIALGGDKKLIAATEVGSAPFPDLLQAYEAHWLYFCVWSDTFINNAEWNSVADLKTVRKAAMIRYVRELTVDRSMRASTCSPWMRSRAGVAEKHPSVPRNIFHCRYSIETICTLLLKIS